MVEIIKNTLVITSFVLTMMLIIEFINIKSRGIWSDKLASSKWMQLIMAAILGAIPGCMGTYTVVSLYTHNVVGMGALISALIATSGDEAFVMISLIPETALLLTVLLFVLAIAAGFVVNLFIRSKPVSVHDESHYPIHGNEENCHVHEAGIVRKFRNISFPRAILIFGILLFGFGLIIGDFSHEHGVPDEMKLNLPHEIVFTPEDCTHDHSDGSIHEHAHGNLSEEGVAAPEEHAHEGHWDWMTFTLLMSLLVALIIVIMVPDHFLEHHLWGHIIKKHFLKIFLWTLGAMLLIHFIIGMVEIESWLKSNQLLILALALMIGLIPESGPHLVFITLFMN
jgi:hypothetical protein